MISDDVGVTQSSAVSVEHKKPGRRLLLLHAPQAMRIHVVLLFCFIIYSNDSCF